MKNPNSGIWRPARNDKFPKKQLLYIQSFFQDDLLKAWQDYDRWSIFCEKHPNLTQSKKGFKNMLMVCKRSIYESEQNLKTIGILLELNK